MLHPTYKRYIEVEYTDLSEKSREAVDSCRGNGINNDSYYVFSDIPIVEALQNWDEFLASAAKEFDIPLQDLLDDDWSEYTLVKEVYDANPVLFHEGVVDGILVSVCW